MNDRTKVRLAKSEGFLFDTRTGRKVLEFGYNELGELLNEVDADQIMASVNKDVPRTSADKGILTEEELKERNRLLVLENDEQNAAIQKLKAAMKETIRIYNESESSSPFGDAVEILEDALEELK